jgi:hypothetical protein
MKMWATDWNYTWYSENVEMNFFPVLKVRHLRQENKYTPITTWQEPF